MASRDEQTRNVASEAVDQPTTRIWRKEYDYYSAWDALAKGKVEPQPSPEPAPCPVCGSSAIRSSGEQWVLLDSGKRVCTNPWHNPHSFDRREPASPEPSAAQQWIEWIEPFGVNNEPVYLRVAREVAIARQRQVAALKNHVYKNDQEALDDFMTVHWASAPPTDKALEPSAAPCSMDAIAARDKLLEDWCDSWNDLSRPTEKREAIQAKLFDETNKLWPTVWPPAEEMCKDCSAAYARGWEVADDASHEYLTSHGAPPSEGKGLYLRFNDLLARASAPPISPQPFKIQEPERERFEKLREDFVERWIDFNKRSIARAGFHAGWQAAISPQPKNVGEISLEEDYLQTLEDVWEALGMADYEGEDSPAKFGEALRKKVAPPISHEWGQVVQNPDGTYARLISSTGAPPISQPSPQVAEPSKESERERLLDKAVEHGRYLASAAEQFQDAYNRRSVLEEEGGEVDVDEFSDIFMRLSTSIFEFRKRASISSRGDTE